MAEPAELLIFLDRIRLADDLRLRLDLTPLPGADLRLDLLDETYSPLATDLSDNLALDEMSAIRLPLSDYPAAAILRLRRAAGEMILHAALLTTEDGCVSSTDRNDSSHSTKEIGASAAGMGNPDASLITGTMSTSTADMSNYDETTKSSHPADAPRTAPATIYVNAETGSDANDGLAPVRGAGVRGAKRTIGAAIHAAIDGDTLCLVGNGVFKERRWDLKGKRLTLRPCGTKNVKVEGDR